MYDNEELVTKLAQKIRRHAESDLYGAEARFEHAQQLFVRSRVMKMEANKLQERAYVLDAQAAEVAEAATELLRGFSSPELFAKVAEYLAEDE